MFGFIMKIIKKNSNIIKISQKFMHYKIIQFNIIEKNMRNK